MSESKMLVVAFDGLDYELIKDFDLENIVQDEFGKIDNETGIENIYTSELFTSFITGSGPEEHGVEGLNRLEKSSKIRFLEKHGSLLPVKFIKRAILTIGFFRGKSFAYSKEDIEKQTLFDDIADSKPLFIPAYNPSLLWAEGFSFELLKRGYSTEQVLDFFDDREYEYRKKTVLEEIRQNKPRKLMMVHFQRPDFHQHFYGDSQVRFERDSLRQLYQQTDDLAGEIKQAATDAGYEYIIFISDHGLPSENGHNSNAFYSSNKPLFESTPKITDFYHRIKEICSDEG